MASLVLKRRVIPVFLLAGERLVKGRQFSDLRDTGDPKSAIRVYSAFESDELLFLDIDDQHSPEKLLRIIAMAADECDMPLSVGGGVVNTKQVERLLMAGADKIVMTSAGLLDPASVTQASTEFGAQCLIAGVEYRNYSEGPRVCTKRGTVDTGIEVGDHVNRLVDLGAGEIFLNCVDKDGTKSGFDLAVISEIAESCPIPLIASGGAGNFQDLIDVFNCGPVAAAACGSLFHFGDNHPIRARSFLRNHGVPMRKLK